jgi:hypothetical protein
MERGRRGKYNGQSSSIVLLVHWRGGDKKFSHDYIGAAVFGAAVFGAAVLGAAVLKT